MVNPKVKIQNLLQTAGRMPRGISEGYNSSLTIFN